MGKLDGKIAIITGAARGLGAAYAKAFAAEGAQVCVSDVLDPSATVTAIESDGGKAIGVTADVTDISACENLVTQTAEAFGGVDILVNNAALFVDIPRRTFLDIDSDEWDKVMAVNVRGSFNCAKAVVPVMRDRGAGSIINISSSTAMKGIPFTLHYVTSKGAIIAMTRALAREEGAHNIRVNALAPGLTLSEAVVEQDEVFAPYNEMSIKGRAFKREQAPDDLIGAAVFLASDDSSFVTGQTMVIDGGDVAY
ncbi:MAG: glucose 1-dehydrogenase [Rhodospirillaceae bacterium]|jgi:NAD(P)-dependent dehydrogenase (short-subunit alcohol dehydrogenase family)|nr:glucose 1-dehydrogenase [Rhodospirillaceae bacterium]MBT5459106.1 glucose 1-dehydrogenase [Rhodospirillaceae bacterium]